MCRLVVVKSACPAFVITAIGLEPVFAGDAGASGTVDALLPLWFAMVQHNAGNRRVALRLTP